MSARVAGRAAVVAGFTALCVALFTAGQVRAAARPCSSYPRPGTTVAGPAPAILRAQYGVLRRVQHAADLIALPSFGVLPESGILRDDIRYLGPVAYGGRAYLVAALHLLPESLAPPRCVDPAERSLRAALLPALRQDYRHRALCLVVVYPTRAAPTCQPAPGTVAAFLLGPGAPGFGLAPDGVSGVVLRFRGNVHAPVRAPVRGNFWSVVDAQLTAAPCGLDWLDSRGVVLRTVADCTTDRS